MDALRREVEKEIVQAGLAIAKTILRHTCPDQEMLADVIQQVIEPLPELEGVKVHLHPSDAALVRAYRESSSASTALKRIEIEEDPSLNSGDISIQSKNGYFDARLAQRFELLEKAIAEQLQKKNADPSSA